MIRNGFVFHPGSLDRCPDRADDPSTHAFLGFSLSSFNGIQEIYWGVNIVALVIWGLISDRLMVREPFMVLGSIGTIVAIILLMNAKKGVSFTDMTLILSLLSTSLACCYCPWFASFTETLESYNPAGQPQRARRARAGEPVVAEHAPRRREQRLPLPRALAALPGTRHAGPPFADSRRAGSGGHHGDDFR